MNRSQLVKNKPRQAAGTCANGSSREKVLCLWNPECAGQRAGGGVAGGEPKRIDAEMNSARAFQAVTSVLREPWKSL